MARSIQSLIIGNGKLILSVFEDSSLNIEIASHPVYGDINIENITMNEMRNLSSLFTNSVLELEHLAKK